MMPDLTPAILCLAHLGWDYVWQRPQQILSRIARHYPVMYIHDPTISSSPEGDPYLKLVTNEAGVTAWQPVFPDRDDVIGPWREVYLNVVLDLLLHQGWIRRADDKLITARPLILWFYTPTPVYFVDHVPADVVVYDVMDELANFKNAARDLPQREALLLAHTDLIFVGGRSLYEARRDRHPHVFLFPSGVDPDHFAQALSPVTEVAEEIAKLPRPILGYYGVIDERIDLELLRDLAAQYPTWSIALVGPVAKIEESQLPRLPNLHYIGQQPYARLPNFLKGFDVCLMPFAINQATRYISPTKALEYMAAHKPIVSTPVPDVVAAWNAIVYIASDAASFASVIEKALSETEMERDERVGREERMLARNTWDYIAGEMRRQIEIALQRKRSQEQIRRTIAE
jgi:UDP-galactopyranose mutase